MTDQTMTPTSSEPEIIAPPGRFSEFWKNFSQNKGALMGLCIIGLLLFCAIFADLIAPHDPIEQFLGGSNKPLPPAWSEGGSSAYFLGTDAVGRDILSRIIHGARLSLFVGFIAVSLSLVTGIIFGLTAGFYGSRIDNLIMRFMDIVLAFPSLLLALGILAILGPGLTNAMIAIAIVNLPHYTRLTRAAVLAERHKDYVTASRLAGASNFRLMINTILPNCWAPLIVQATLGFSSAILDAAALGFLGLGAQPPMPEWGSMLAESLKFVRSSWWIVTFPGLAILITVLAFNLMGDGLRDALDPKLRR